MTLYCFNSNIKFNLFFILDAEKDQSLPRYFEEKLENYYLSCRNLINIVLLQQKIKITMNKGFWLNDELVIKKI